MAEEESGKQTPLRPGDVSGNDREAPGRDSGSGEGHDEPRLNADDQARVDGFLRRGVNSVERKPFRPLLLMVMLIVVVASLSLFSQWLAKEAGVY